MTVDPRIPLPIFVLRPGEAVRDRIVRCCDELLAPGPMGHGLRQETYQPFINCPNTKPPGYTADGRSVNDISGWATSCAIFVRAVFAWCGRHTYPAHNAAGIYDHIQLNPSSRAWRPYKRGVVVRTGDAFYCASNGFDGHVGVFLRETAPGEWETAEGGDNAPGASPGTACKKGHRVLAHFDSRPLVAIIDADLLDLPSTNPVPDDEMPTPIEVPHPTPRPPTPDTSPAPLPVPTDCGVEDAPASALEPASVIVPPPSGKDPLAALVAALVICHFQYLLAV